MSKIDKTYHNLLEKILQEGYDYTDESRDVKCKQISSYELRHNLRTDGFPALTTKKLYWKGIVGELIWFLRGDINIKYLVDNNINFWNKDAYNYFKKQKYPISSGLNEFEIEDFILAIKNNNYKEYALGDLGPVYGHLWRNFNGVDQVKELIKGLTSENPMTRRHIVTAWDPSKKDEQALPPCHWSWEIIPRPLNQDELERYSNKSEEFLDGLYEKCNENEKVYLEELSKLSFKYTFDLKWHQRSVDTFLGLPFNIASYALLANIIGKITNMIPNELIGDLSNVHIYHPHIEAVKKQLSRDSDKFDKIEVKIKERFEYDRLRLDRVSLDNLLSNIEIEDFILENYESYPTISAEMLAPNK